MLTWAEAAVGALVGVLLLLLLLESPFTVHSLALSSSGPGGPESCVCALV